MDPIHIVILIPSGHPKNMKFDLLFAANLIYFEDGGDKQCRRINECFFSKELMLFQQFCCSGVGGY